MYLVDYIRDAGGLGQALTKARHARLMGGLPNSPYSVNSCQPQYHSDNARFFATNKACFKCRACIRLLLSELGRMIKEAKQSQPDGWKVAGFSDITLANASARLGHHPGIFYERQDKIVVLHFPVPTLAHLTKLLGPPK